jgi:hypothetical protein
MQMKVFAAAALVAALAACDGGTSVRDANATGKWLYRADVAGCQMTTVVRISQSGSTLGGMVSPVMASCRGSAGYYTLPADSNVSVSGAVHGDSVTFTLHFPAWGWTLVHSAAIRADSISGAVAGPNGAAGPETGAFGARRYTTEVLPDRFRVSLTGAVTDSMEGGTQSDQFGATFYSDAGTAAGYLFRYGSGGTFPLVPGTYRIYDHTVVHDSLSGGIDYRGRAYRFRDGTATVTAVGPDHYQGTFEANGYLTTDTTQKIHAVGAYNPGYYIRQ